MESFFINNTCKNCGKKCFYIIPENTCYECYFKNFAKNLQKCEHTDTSIVVIETNVTCEKTAIKCNNCGEILTEPKTDCR